MGLVCLSFSASFWADSLHAWIFSGSKIFCGCVYAAFRCGRCATCGDYRFDRFVCGRICRFVFVRWSVSDRFLFIIVLFILSVLLWTFCSGLLLHFCDGSWLVSVRFDWSTGGIIDDIRIALRSWRIFWCSFDIFFCDFVHGSGCERPGVRKFCDMAVFLRLVNLFCFGSSLVAVRDGRSYPG